MKNSKLIELLRSLTPAEFRQFNDFVASPYFNKNEDLIALAAILGTLAPDFPTNEIKKEKIFSALFPGEAFDQKKMAYLMNYLLKLAERFLSIEGYEQHKMLNNCFVLEQFVDRKLDKHYSYLLHKTGQQLEDPEHRDGDSFYHQYLLARVGTKHFYSKQIRKFDPSLQSVSDELDKFYFFHKLKYSCEMLNRQAIIKADYQLTFTEEVKEYLLKQSDVDPLIEIYLHIYLSIAFPDDENYFEQLMALIEAYAAAIDQKTRREIFLYAINYCAPKIRRGKEKYAAIMLELYIKGIENRSLFDDTYLSHWTYSNVVKLALRLERYNWAESFIREYVSSLPPSLREDAEHFNLAELYYYKKDFDLVLTHLNQLHFSDLHYHLGSRVTLLKTYYELDAEESLLSLLAAFTVYLRRNKKISVPMKKNCMNFCNLLHQVLRQNPKKWEKIGQDIQQTQPLAERAWLYNAWKEIGQTVKA